MEWIDFWNEFPDRFDKNEFLRQVGKTFKGQPITDDIIELIVANIKQKIQLNSSDIVLDLCCGNGLLTKRIAQDCRQVTAIDYSERLIKIAKNNFARQNISYLQMSAMDILPDVIQEKPFTKIYMYEALQHFCENQLSPLIDELINISDEHAIMFFASILDSERIWSFYNTPELQREYYEQKEKGSLLLGTWWNKSFIQEICYEKKLECEILDQPAKLYTANYRFDVLIRK